MTVVSIVQRAGNTAESAPAGALRLVVIWVVGAALVNAATSGDLACGDLALTGCDLVGQFIAYRSGHRLNAELAKVLMTEAELRGNWRRSA